jgi:hypothetical protein
MCFPSFLLHSFVCFIMALHAFGSPISPTSLALHLGAPLAYSPCLALGHPTLARLFVCFVTALRAFGCPSCELTLHFIWAPLSYNSNFLAIGRPILAKPYQKSYLRSKIGSYLSFDSSFFLVLPCVVMFCYGSSCVSLRALHAFGHPSCQLVLHFVNHMFI